MRLAPYEGTADTGFGTTQVIRTTGASKRQLEYWNDTTILSPSIQRKVGSGEGRDNLYSFKDVVLVKVAVNLLDTGVLLSRVEVFLDHLRSLDDMRGSFVCDGVRTVPIEDGDSTRAVIDLGASFFAINVEMVWRDMERALGSVQA